MIDNSESDIHSISGPRHAREMAVCVYFPPRFFPGSVHGPSVPLTDPTKHPCASDETDDMIMKHILLYVLSDVEKGIQLCGAQMFAFFILRQLEYHFTPVGIPEWSLLYASWNTGQPFLRLTEYQTKKSIFLLLLCIICLILPYKQFVLWMTKETQPTSW